MLTSELFKVQNRMEFTRAAHNAPVAISCCLGAVICQCVCVTDGAQTQLCKRAEADVTVGSTLTHLRRSNSDTLGFFFFRGAGGVDSRALIWLRVLGSDETANACRLRTGHRT